MEGLRVFPPVPMTIRKAAKGDYVDDVWVPKGTIFYIAVSILLRMVILSSWLLN